MKLVLHAGTHKTGTTSIQKVLSDNRTWLRDRGLIYPDGEGVYSPKAPLKTHHVFARSFTGIGHAKTYRINNAWPGRANTQAGRFLNKTSRHSPRLSRSCLGAMLKVSSILSVARTE
jgi:hypothetical protein